MWYIKISTLNTNRYERVRTDCLPLSNGKKSNNENGRSIISNGLMNTTTTSSTTTSTSTSFESKGFTFKSSSSRSQDHHHHHHQNASSPSHSDASPNPSPSPNKDLFLQWGQKKRARVSRSEIRALADESSSSAQAKQPINKLPRRADSKFSTPSMPPPPPPPPPSQQHSANNNNSSSISKGRNFRSSLPHRILEKRSGAGNVSPSRNSGGSSRVVSRSTAGKRSPPTPEKIDKKIPNCRPAKYEKPNGSMPQADHMNHTDTTPAQSEQEASFNNITPSIPAAGGEKLIAEVIEWPRILIALSRKEKEDDFFAMKGTKLPQRPKKRAKNIDKTLQYCFPGMWLSDLTKSRYEVREKKSVKKAVEAPCP
ncbi:conserved hypothetical protein [Ricinus communis]|uniref:Uncharacterized protein n=1 Tax=Ricinus communis TaxID=3988 RepID=B9T386_RICCO|nr:conserved hypothetical protein [Ricinus communis]